jgi:membrane protein YdbS with pleckstrin-like domain
MTAQRTRRTKGIGMDEALPPPPPSAQPVHPDTTGVPLGPQPLDERILTVWRLAATVRLAPPLLLLAVVAAARVPGPWWIGPGLASLALGVTLGPLQALRWRHFRWELTADAIELHHGVLVRRHVTVPFFRMQQIDVIEGPLERLVGLATLVVTTASAGGSVALPGIASRAAPDLRRELVARASDATARHSTEGRDAV